MVRSLQKQVRQYEKYERCQEENRTFDSEDTYPDLTPKEGMCEVKDCDGKLNVLEAPHATYISCDTCTYRKRLK